MTQLKEIFIVEVNVFYDEKLMDSTLHGAFISFRDASKWIVEAGFEAFCDDDLSEFYDEETISFLYFDKSNNEEHRAYITNFSIQESA